MREELTHFDHHDIFGLFNDSQLCRFNRFKLTKEEFLSMEFIVRDSKPVNKCLIYLYMPEGLDITMCEFTTLIDRLVETTDDADILWGISSNNILPHFEVVLIKAYWHNEN